ncbi:hypothetical protein EV182_002536 [Spiromyces aspiralis]|uniref:Uncharacterized protein n=1 Tax=Spiromyces aspiralis TaxID=68401 RepID=A0ACC1HRN0_9FUNG|nr:hypothetical protein EV182_002536 [Spiromyces aspiralis]
MLAARVRRIAAKVIKRLKENYAQMPVDPNTGHLKVPFNPEIWTYNLTRLPELEKRPEDEKVTTDDPEDDQGKRKEVVQDTEVPSTPVPLTGDSDKEGTRRRKRGWRKELSPLVTRTEPPATRLRSRTGSCHPETPTSGTTPSTDAPKGRRKNVRGWIWVPEAESSESPSPTVPDEEATAVTPTLPRLRSQTTSTGDAEASTPDDSPLKTQEETMLLRPKRKASLSLPQVGRAASPTGFAQMSPPRKRKKSGSLLLTAFEPPQRRPKDFGPDPTKWPVNTLVWAKMQSYPWFPAEIYDPSDPEIPEDVHKDRDELGSSGSNMVLVHFFDRASRRTWKWLEPKFVVQLGIDDKIDKYYYSAKLAKSNHMVQSIRTAYMRACEAIEARHS